MCEIYFLFKYFTAMKQYFYRYISTDLVKLLKKSLLISILQTIWHWLVSKVHQVKRWYKSFWTLKRQKKLCRKNKLVSIRKHSFNRRNQTIDWYKQKSNMSINQIKKRNYKSAQKIASLCGLTRKHSYSKTLFTAITFHPQNDET